MRHCAVCSSFAHAHSLFIDYGYSTACACLVQCNQICNLMQLISAHDGTVRFASIALIRERDN